MRGDYESIPDHLRQVRLYRRLQAGRIPVSADLLEQYTVGTEDELWPEDALRVDEEAVLPEAVLPEVESASSAQEAAPLGLLGQLGRWISRRSGRP